MTGQDGEPNASAAGTLALGGDLDVNRMGFGAMRITGLGLWGEPEEAKAVLRRAVALGVNFIDTADSYGPGVSERLIAEALHPYPEGLVIATKGVLIRPGPTRGVPDGRPEHLRETCEGSLGRLKVDRIDLYHAGVVRGIRARDHPREDAGLHRAYRGGKHFGAAPYGYRTDDRGLLQERAMTVLEEKNRYPNRKNERGNLLRISSVAPPAAPARATTRVVGARSTTTTRAVPQRPTPSAWHPRIRPPS
jgi:hypothetical protein